MLKNINIREAQWTEDRKAELKAIGWDFSKPLKAYAGELPTQKDQAWDEARKKLGFTEKCVIPPPQDADQVLAEEFEEEKQSDKSTIGA